MTFLCLTAPFFFVWCGVFSFKKVSFFFLFIEFCDRGVCLYVSTIAFCILLFFLSGFSHLFLDLFLSTVCFPLLYLKDLAK